MDTQLTADPMAPLVPPKLYRMGELVQHTGLSRQTIHNYTVFGLIKEADWTPGGHRLYDESVFARLGVILRLKRDHSVEQIKTFLELADDRERDSADKTQSGDN